MPSGRRRAEGGGQGYPGRAHAGAAAALSAGAPYCRLFTMSNSVGAPATGAAGSRREPMPQWEQNKNILSDRSSVNRHDSGMRQSGDDVVGVLLTPEVDDLVDHRGLRSWIHLLGELAGCRGGHGMGLEQPPGGMQQARGQRRRFWFDTGQRPDLRWGMGRGATTNPRMPAESSDNSESLLARR